MLKLCNVTKDYLVSDNTIHALRGIDIEFRENEFVAVLGQSGCGKTTLLNIIGGLDRYTDGSLSVNGRETKDFSDADWDSYRNHSIGFVFQSYNLIPHQTVLANVELALTLSGVSRSERRAKAVAVLEKVGLGDQLEKKPNQMSGGQMQRVAIARALVNDPEILLADEPTGALDSETSVQIMEILKEIAKEKLIIMVTHNPDIASEYATRIVRLLDGRITDDSDPYKTERPTLTPDELKEQKKQRKRMHTTMGFGTALSLSLNNLLTKKARTILTSFAGSIGIIGIALILSLSRGFKAYIDRVQKETLSTYPLSITKETADMSSVFESMAGAKQESATHENDKVYINDAATDMMNSFLADVKVNDMKSFKAWLDSEECTIDDKATIQYSYDMTLNIYDPLTSEIVNPNPFTEKLYGIFGMNSDNTSSSMTSMMSQYNSAYNCWTELTDNTKLYEEQYDVISGRWASEYNECVLFVDENNEILELTLYGLGLLDPDNIEEQITKAMSGEELAENTTSYAYEDLVGKKFKVVPNTDFYVKNDEGGWSNNKSDAEFVDTLIENGIDLTITGIVRPKADAVAVAVTGGIVGYSSELVKKVSKIINSSEIGAAQLSDPDTDVFTGLPFQERKAVTIEDVYAYIDSMSDEELQQLQTMFASLYGNSIQSEDVLSIINAMSDEEILANIAPQILAATTIDDAKAFAASEQGQAALIQVLSAQMGTQVDATALQGLTDEQLLSTYKGIIQASLTADQIRAQISAMSPEELTALTSGVDTAGSAESIKAMLSGIDEQTLLSAFEEQVKSQSTDNTYDSNLIKLNIIDLDVPSSINIFPTDFAAKDLISEEITQYNDRMTAEGAEEKVIDYTDYIGLLLSSVTKIIDTISYVLISFVAISLVVSSIMIGIITYISVLERTKEIGILRSIGASKRDISRVFNAETLIVGLTAGLFGVGITVLLNIPINIVIEAVSDIANVSHLPALDGLVLVAISMVLTLIAGIIPSRLAAKKDPVVALRTE